MYNLVKLLTEEPQKLERLGILLLKLLVTLFIVNTLFGLGISISEVVENPLPKNYTIIKFMVFLIYLIIAWFIIWSIIAEFILSDILIWLLSKIGNKKDTFYDILEFLRVVKKEKERFLPDKNILIFNSFLINFSEEDQKFIEERESRIRQYYIIALVIFVVLICTKDILLPIWLKCLCIAVIVTLLLVNVVLKQNFSYFKKNIEELKKEFGNMAYFQMISNAIELNPFIKSHYEKKKTIRSFNLKRKTEIESFPETLNFYPCFYWNKGLLQELLKKGIQEGIRNNIPTDKTRTHYDVLISNVKPDDENVKGILSQKCFAYLYCENEDQMIKNLDILIFKLTNRMY